MFRENTRSKFTLHLMYIVRKVTYISTYLDVAVYDISYMRGQTWRLFEREINLFSTLGSRCSFSRFSIPSIAVSPSKHQVILHGFGPGECANLLLVYQDRKTRVIGAEQTPGKHHIGNFGSVLVTIPVPSLLERKFNLSASTFYLISLGGGCSWEVFVRSKELCAQSSSSLHRLLVQDYVAGEWEFVQTSGIKKLKRSLFTRLYPDDDNLILIFGGISQYARRKASASLFTMVIQRFDIFTSTWIQLKTNTIHYDLSGREDYFKRVESVSYVRASRRWLTLYWAWPSLFMSCSIGETAVNCERPVTPQSSVLFYIGDTFQLSFGQGNVFLVRTNSRIIKTIISEVYEANKTIQRWDFVDIKAQIPQHFPGFATASAISTPAILVPTGTVRSRTYVFFGSPGNTALFSAMPTWILETRSGTTGFRYTVFHPRPGPDIPQRIGHTVTLMTNSTAILYGGSNVHVPSLRVEKDPYPWCFNLQQHFWTKATFTTGNVPTARKQHVSFRYNATAMIIHGGVQIYQPDDLGFEPRILGELWVFIVDDEDQCQGRWHNLTAHVKKGHLPRQYSHTATPTDGGVILYGGAYPTSPVLRPSVLTFLCIRSLSEVLVHDILISPSIPTRIGHSLSYFNSDLILLGGEQHEGRGPRVTTAKWALLISFRTNVTSTVATWTRFFQSIISGHTVLGDTVFGGDVINPRELSHFSILNTTGLCPIGHERDQNNTCHPCAIGYYSASLQQQCTKCNQSLTTSSVASSHCVPEGPCKPHICNHGNCIVDEVNFKHICVCQFGYLPDDDCKTPSIYLALMAALVFTSTLTILTIALIQFLRKRRALNAKELELVKTNRDLYRSKRKLSQLDHGTYIAWSDMKIKKQLATGRFSKVLLAELGDITVVVKRLPTFVATASPDDAFIREAEVLRTLRHPNIVMFLGAGRDKRSGCPFLVMEYLRRGSLYDVIHGESKVIEHIDRLRFSLDAARGIKYLHSTSPPRIHRDIKSANMLVSDKWVVKVADMETTRFLAILRANTDPKETSPSAANGEMDRPTRTTSFTSQESDLLTTPLLATTGTVLADDSHGNTQDRHRDTEGMTSRIGMTCGVGTDRWRSPESIKKNLYTEKHDVYSFGVVMWELSTRQIPYGHLHNSDDVLDEIAGGSKLIFPPSIRYAYRHLAEQCIKTDPEERPSMHRVVHELTSQLDSF
ncbi:uncharacterized protein LOC135817129 [Sycon ciliatum]|uniref:uncharacterized protein LOC135817129 n=1 Tax=Sycon ciliatum TaxID=27933 RepID=UPI0031F63F64